MVDCSKKKIKVAVGMSGGVDSSVAAKLLLDQGYEVVGFMMKLWSGSEMKCTRDNACCDIDGLQDAKRVAKILNIPFYVIDVREKFKKEVADYFIEEYKNLRTPNPCVKCNEKIKFGWLLDFAEKTGCSYLATGHYARIDKDSEGHFHLLKGKDSGKDQSYFLYSLTQKQLSKIIFPLGENTKEEVRVMAKKWNLPVHEKKESQEICFVQEKDYREFLQKNIPTKFFKSGNIVDLSGNIIGKHDGLINYTIGQRKGIEQTKGLQISNSKFLISKQIPKPKTQNKTTCHSEFSSESHGIPKQVRDDRIKDKQPLYVVGFDVNKNQLIVGGDEDIYKDKMTIGNLSWINQNTEYRIQNTEDLKVKIRYRHPAVGCRATRIQNTEYRIQFDQPQRAITPGQSAVFYSGEEVLGGGVIL